jgi:hypothetical protein
LGVVLQQFPHLLGLAEYRAHASDRAERSRGAQQAQRVPGRGRVEHDQVIPRRAPPPLAAGQLPDLDHAHQLFRARCGGGEVLKRPAPGEHTTGHASAERLQPFQQRPVGVDRDAPQILPERRLGARV